MFIESVPPQVSDVNELLPILQRMVDYINSAQRTTIINDGVTNRYLIGYQKDGWGQGKDFGIKISKENVDVTSASDADLVYKSDFTSEYYYEAGLEYMRIGKLPNGQGGIAIVKPGVNLPDAY